MFFGCRRCREISTGGEISETSMDPINKLWNAIRNLDSGMAQASSDSSFTIEMDVQHWKQRRSARLFGLAWLFYLAYPFSDLIRGHQPTGQTVLGAVGLIVFVAVYLYAYFRTFYNHVGVWRTWAPVVMLALIAAVVTLWVNHSWIGIMIYVATAAGCSQRANRHPSHDRFECIHHDRRCSLGCVTYLHRADHD